jgi:hypothetical protein
MFGAVSLSYANRPTWRTGFDTVDKCDPAILAIVGDTVLGTLDALEKAD